jgi:hypothetical protein
MPLTALKDVPVEMKDEMTWQVCAGLIFRRSRNIVT